MTSHILLTAIFDDAVTAGRAIDRLEDADVAPRAITLLMAEDQRKGFERPIDQAADPAAQETVRGAKVGSVVGGTLAVLAAAAVSLTGVGFVVAGPLTALVVAGAAGATAGGLLGALVGLGVRGDIARVYERRLADGAILVGVTTSEERCAELETLLVQAGGHDFARMDRAN